MYRLFMAGLLGWCLSSYFKAAIFSIFIIILYEMTVCNVLFVAHSDEPTEIYQ